MFESLDERIERDENRESSKKERYMHYWVIGALSSAIIVGVAAAFQYVK